MGMDSEKIKAIVAQVKALERGEQGPEDVMTAMVRDMTRSPTFAVAIIQRLRDEGIDLMAEEGEAADALRLKFEARVSGLSDRDVDQIKKIATKLFN